MAEIHLNVSSFNECSSPLFARAALIAPSIFAIEYNLIVVSQGAQALICVSVVYFSVYLF